MGLRGEGGGTAAATLTGFAAVEAAAGVGLRSDFATATGVALTFFVAFAAVVFIQLNLNHSIFVSRKLALL